jgi:hypothetical protein
VTVAITPPKDVSYVRGVFGNDKDKPPTVACIEEGSLDTSPAIQDVWFSNEALYPQTLEQRNGETQDVAVEEVRLQFDRKVPDRKLPGMIVNHPAVTKRIKADGTIDREGLLAALEIQRLEGAMGMPPLYTSAAYEADQATLKAIGLLNMKLTLSEK